MVKTRREQRALDRKIKRTCGRGDHLPKTGSDPNKPYCARCGDLLPLRRSSSE